jgi:hypothetical protein
MNTEFKNHKIVLLPSNEEIEVGKLRMLHLMSSYEVDCGRWKNISKQR